MTEKKRCVGCGETKPATGFTPNRHVRDGLQSRCKACRCVYTQNARFSLTRAERDYLDAMQLHRCAVCLDPLGDNRQVDHDHRCCPGTKSCGGCVRGVVHKRCNQLVSVYEHGRTLRDPEMAELVVFYIDMTPIRMTPFRAYRAVLGCPPVTEAA